MINCKKRTVMENKERNSNNTLESVLKRAE